ncbi:MAG TPA: DUF5719 family protein [Nocardioides sp.]|nr:DUF5719 family protein [Nocardioides sp.]
MTEPRSTRRADTHASAPGRRSGGGRRIDLLVGLAVALPAVVSIALAAVGGGSSTSAGSLPPVSTGLTSATLVCPAALHKHPAPVVVARAPEVAGGAVQVSRAGSGGSLAPGGTVTATADHNGRIAGGGASVITASGTAAPGLVAGRREPEASAACLTPAYDEWYVGLGASAVNDSVLTLVNPDGGQAVVDVELIGQQGPTSATALRGMVVPGHRSVSIDLGKRAPSQLSLAAHVMVSRGRVGVSVEHRYDRLGGAAVVSDYLPALDESSTDGLLLGATVEGQTLMLVNPGEEPANATIRVLNGESVFTPVGTKPVVVPPQSLVRVPLPNVVPTSAVNGMLGLVVQSDQPLLATSRGIVSSDLNVVGMSPTVTGPTAAIVPDGPSRLVIAGAQRTGVVNLTFRNAAGRVLAQKAVPVTAQAGVSVVLPSSAAVVTLDPRNTAVSASIVTTGRKGSSVVPVRDTVRTASVPAVLPN